MRSPAAALDFLKLAIVIQPRREAKTGEDRGTEKEICIVRGATRRHSAPLGATRHHSAPLGAIRRLAACGWLSTRNSEEPNPTDAATDCKLFVVKGKTTSEQNTQFTTKKKYDLSHNRTT